MKKINFSLLGLFVAILVTSCIDEEPIIALQSIQFQNETKEYEIEEGSTKRVTLPITFQPENATYQDLQWTSSNENIATVDTSGVVKLTGKKEGQVTITATHTAHGESDNTVSTSCKITVNFWDPTKKLKDVAFTQETYYIYKGDMLSLCDSLVFTPSYVASYFNPTFITSDPSKVEMVENGVFKGKDLGKNILITALVNETFKPVCKVSVIEFVPLSSIQFESSDYYLSPTEEPMHLTPVFAPETALYREVEWTSSNPEVATVNAEGLVSVGTKEGTTTITATHKPVSLKDKQVTGSCVVHVQTTPIESIILPDNFKMPLNTTKNIKATIVPDYATFQDITWSSSNSSILSVSEEGVLTTYNQTGTVTITAIHEPASSGDVEVSATVEVEVIEQVIPIQSITLNATKVGLLRNGEMSYQLEATISPSNASFKDLVWSTADDCVATVDETGLVVSGACIGITTITVTHESVVEGDVTQSATCEVSTYGYDWLFHFAFVQKGTFMMGCTSEQIDNIYGYDKPVHQVTLTKSFYMGTTEVTQEQYEIVMGTNPVPEGKFRGKNKPVVNVTVEDAKAFCKKLSQLTGETYKLPTEAQWEYAARGGHKAVKQTRYAGSDVPEDVAWYGEHPDGGCFHDVAQKKPNALGLYDMSGNVMEICSDYYESKYPSSQPQTDPTGPEPDTGSTVHRGGAYYHKKDHVQVSTRDGYYDYDIKTTSSGFRIIQEL